MLCIQKKMKMKKILLSLAVVFVLLSFTTATNTERINIETVALEEVNPDIDFSNDISLLEVTTSTKGSDLCGRFGGAIFQSALEDGYSFQDALDIGTGAKFICQILVIVGLLL